jgi:glycosyltransferase involved in cell wall biosynthesis
MVRKGDDCIMIHVGIAYTFHDNDWLGGRNYFASLFEAIEIHAKPKLRVTLIVGHRTQTTLPEQFPWVRVLRTSALDRYHPLWWARQLDLRIRNRDRVLQGILRHANVDVLSHSGYLGKGSPVPCVDWLYDFQFMHLPELWKPRHIRRVTRRYRAACATCDGVILSSNSALADLRTFAPDCRAHSHVLRFVSNRIDERDLPSPESLRDKYRLPTQFFYLPNQFWENKNHRLVVDALKLLKDRGEAVHIVCSGKTADGRQPRFFQRLLEHIQRAGVADRFHILGIIPRKDALGLMRTAIAVLNPSRFEGWSTTVEEAKTLGVPMVLSDIPVHREQVTTNGTFIHPDRPDSLAQALTTHLAMQSSEPPGPFVDFNTRLSMFAGTYVSILEQTVDDRRSTPPENRARRSQYQSALDRANLFVKSIAWRYPSIARMQPFARSMQPGSRLKIRELLRNNYDLIVDGYPRSGNSRLACAIRLVAPNLRVRSHAHQIAHVRQAIVRHGKPAIIMIRKPADAIPACAFHRCWSIAYASRYYEMYYEQLLDLIGRPGLLVVDFDTVLSGLNATLQAISARYPSILCDPRIPEDLEAQTNRKIRELPWGKSPLTVSLPDAERSLQVQRLNDELSDAPGSGRSRRLDEIYRRVISSSAMLRLQSDVLCRGAANGS